MILAWVASRNLETMVTMAMQQTEFDPQLVLFKTVTDGSPLGLQTMYEPD